MIKLRVDWPTSIIERKLCEAATTVHGAFKLLDAQNPEKHEDEQHEGDCIEERINGANERRNKLPHLRKGLDAAERAQNTQCP